MSLIALQDAQETQRVGGKAAALGSLLRAGERAPPGFVIPDEHFARFITASGHREDIDALQASVAGEGHQALAEASAQIAAWLAEVPLPEPLEQQLAQAYQTLGAGRVVVRSSAIGEDSAAASFAGQLDSFLDIQGEQALFDGVRRCWSSFYSARALAYQHATGAPLRGMGVVVQPQIEGAISGVAFTRSPLSPDSLLIEYCEGGCEALVSGEIVPFSVSLPREGRARPAPDSPTPELLTPAQLEALMGVFMGLEQHFGGPQDVEWTIDPQGQLHLLQSRPITTAAAQPVGEEAVFSNANINENYPDPVTPLLQSIAQTSYYHYFRNIGAAYGIDERRLQAAEDPLRGIVAVHGQRLYYDVSNIHAVLRVAPMGDLFADWFNSFVGVEVTTDTGERDPTWRRGTGGRLRETRELLHIARSVYGQYDRITAQVETYEGVVSAYAARCTPQQLRGLDTEQLLERLAGFIDIRCNQWGGAGLSDAACMVCCGALERFLGGNFSEPGPVLLHGLLRGLPDIVSSEPPRKLWQLSRQIRADEGLMTLFAGDTEQVLSALGWDGEAMRTGGASPEGVFAQALNRFLEDWGFRCTGELMFSVDSFQERPHAVVDMLRSYAGMSGQGPGDVIAQQGALRVEQTEALAAQLSWPKRRAFRWLLKATGQSLSLRERSRLKQALLYRCCRRVVLALSARLHASGALEHVDDALYMTWQELLALRAGPEQAEPPRHAIASRRRDFVEQSDWPPAPPRMRMRRDQRWTPSDEGPPLVAFEDGSDLKGLAAAAGKVTARATVARGQQDFHLVAAGDVLVAPQTDPGWATVLFLVRGLVMERGGMLSHGAIIAREFGIPSVVAVERATERIPQGSTVTVDGDVGLVRVLE